MEKENTVIEIVGCHKYIVLATGLLLVTNISTLEKVLPELSHKYLKQQLKLLRMDGILQQSKTKNKDDYIRLTKRKGLDLLYEYSQEIYAHYMWLTYNHENLVREEKLYTILNFMYKEGCCINFFQLNFHKKNYKQNENENNVLYNHWNIVSLFSIEDDIIKVKDYSYMLRNIDSESKYFLPMRLFKEVNKIKTLSEKTQQTRITQSRAMGLLLAEENVYPVYFINKNSFKWNHKIEQSFACNIKDELVQLHKKVNPYEISINQLTSSIFFYNYSEAFRGLVEDGEKYRSTFSHIHLVSLEEQIGEKTFKIITTKNWQKRLRKKLYNLDDENIQDNIHGSDAYLKDGRPIYEFISMDLKKILSAIKVIKTPDKENIKNRVVIVILESQEELIKSVFKEKYLNRIEFKMVNDIEILKAFQ